MFVFGVEKTGVSDLVMNNADKILRIPIEYTKKELIEFCHRVVEINEPFFNDTDEHRLMIDVSRGLLGIYNGIEGLDSGPNLIIADFPLRWTVRNMYGDIDGASEDLMKINEIKINHIKNEQ